MPVGNPNWFAALPINDLVRWSFNADRCFIIMPRSDSDDGYGRQRANPDHLDEPLNALVNMGDSNNRYLQYVDYGAGNIDWISADGREQISWTGGTMRYTHGVLAGTIAQHLTGQAENGARVEYDKAGGGGSYTSELIGDSTSPDQYIWRHGVRYDVGGEVRGAMAYSEPGHHYFIVAYRATTEIPFTRTIKLFRIEFDPDTDQTIGSPEELTSDLITDCGGGIPTGSDILQPIFFNRAGTELCTIAGLSIDGNTDYYIITAAATNSGRSTWTFKRGERCIKRDTKTETNVHSISYGSAIEYDPGLWWLIPASQSRITTSNSHYKSIFAVDWCNEQLTTATLTESKTESYNEQHPSYHYVSSSASTDNISGAIGLGIDILFPEDELGDYWGDSTITQSSTITTYIDIAGGWSQRYQLSNYTDSAVGEYHISYEVTGAWVTAETPAVVSGSGGRTGTKRALMYLDMRHRHIVYVDLPQAQSGGAANLYSNGTLDISTSNNETINVVNVLFGSSQSEAVYTYSTSGLIQLVDTFPSRTGSSAVNTSVAYGTVNGPWYGNSNWTTIATLADGKTAWLHMAVNWPGPSSLPWSPSNANSRHWINRTVGPLAPASLSTIANGVGLSGSNPRFHAVRPAIIPSPETSPDAPE